MRPSRLLRAGALCAAIAAVAPLGLSSSPSRAALIGVTSVNCDERGQGCEDALELTARAGETNRLSIGPEGTKSTVVKDAGAALQIRRPCVGSANVAVCPVRGHLLASLKDGDDTIRTNGLSGDVEPGPGNDFVQGERGGLYVYDSPGADEMVGGEPGGAIAVTYFTATSGVSVRPDGLADDGTAGEGDNVHGTITRISGGPGADTLVGGPSTALLDGGEGGDVLDNSASVTASELQGGAGANRLIGGSSADRLTADTGADSFSGGPGVDTVDYHSYLPRGSQTGSTRERTRASIGDGPNDGQAGEGDDVHTDIENLTGSEKPDVLVGSDQINRLAGGGGRDTLIGLAGNDRLLGGGRGLLVPGPGVDRAITLAGDRLDTRDGGSDRVRCSEYAPSAVFDRADIFETCAPRTDFVDGPYRVRHGKMRLRLVCAHAGGGRCQGRVAIRARGRRGIDRRWHPGRLMGRRSFARLRPGARRTVTIRVRVRGAGRGRRRIKIGVHTLTRNGSPQSTTPFALPEILLRH